MSDTANHEHGNKGPGNLVVWGALAVLLFFLLTEHRAHLFGALPYLLLLACPLMHLFMHGGHHRHADREEEKPSRNSGCGGGHRHEHPPEESAAKNKEEDKP